MTRENVVIVRCNRCNDPTLPLDTEASIVDMALRGSSTTRFSGENCDACAAELDEKLDALLDEFLEREARKRSRLGASSGIPQAPRKPRAPRGSLPHSTFGRSGDIPAEDRTCPQCKYVCPTRGALGQHLKSKHGLLLADVGMNKIASVSRRKG